MIFITLILCTVLLVCMIAGDTVRLTVHDVYVILEYNIDKNSNVGDENLVIWIAIFLAAAALFVFLITALISYLFKKFPIYVCSEIYLFLIFVKKYDKIQARQFIEKLP